jgi:hypothetical protein
LVFAHFKTEKTEIVLVILFEGEAAPERQRRRWIHVINLMELAELRIAACPGHHARNLETLDHIREALIVVDVSGQDEIGVSLSSFEAVKQYLLNYVLPECSTSPENGG